MSYTSIIEHLEAMRDSFRSVSEEHTRTAAVAENEYSKGYYSGKADARSSAAADLSRLITIVKAHPTTYKVVVCMDHGCYDSIYTTAPEGMLEAHVHTYDLDELPTPQVFEAHPIHVDDETIAPYLRPHGLMVKNLKADLEMLDDEVLVAIPDETGTITYYPVVVARSVRRSGYTVLEPIYPLQAVDQPVPDSI